MLKLSREDGFTITEMLVSSTVMLLIVGGALTTFKNAVALNDAASQLGDSTQNLRAGTNLLVRDLMMAGRIFGAEGVALPTCGGAVPFNRPGPVAGFFNTVSVELDANGNTVTLNLPSITTGYQIGPVIKGSATDMVTIMTVDEFMPVIYHSPPPAAAVAPTIAGTIAPDGLSVLLPVNSPWLVVDTVNDTQPMKVGDLVLFKGAASAIQTITRMDATHIYFDNNGADFFKFNQPCAAPNWPMAAIRQDALAVPPAVVNPPPNATFAFPVSMFRAMMITYYVDCPLATCPSQTPPRLTRQINSKTAAGDFAPTALAGVVEDLDITYDLVDGINNPAARWTLPWTDTTQNPNITYNSNQIRKVNVHLGVRSEQMSKPTQDYVRNHINTSVDVRSMASVDRYKTASEVQ